MYNYLQKNKRLLLNSIAIVIFYIILGISFGGKHKYIYPITCGFIFIYSYLFTETKISLKLIISVIILIEIIFLSILFFSSDTLKANLQVYILTIPIVSYLGCLTKINKKYFLLFILFMVFMILILKPNWSSYIDNYHSAKNIKLPNIEFKSIQESKVEMDKGIIVLDFWTTSCGVCFKKFPEFEKLKMEYENNTKVKFYSVNVPLKNDTREKTKRIIKNLNYNYETIFANNLKEINDSLHFNSFPMLMIIQNGKIRYEGDLLIEKNVLIHNTRNEINKLIQ